MKKILFLIAFLVITVVHAQVPITSYFGLANYTYANIDPPTPLSHATLGANAVWTFNFLPTNGTSNESNIAPTAAETTSYPGTTSVHLATTATPSPSNSAKIFNRLTAGNVFSLTGFDADGVILNYVTNNALLGTFPLNFGYTNTDPTAGSFTNGTTSGTFTGTVKTDYDSYGTLNLGVIGFSPIVKTVYRIKVDQNINLSIPFIGNIGTVTQVTYTYYSNNAGVVEPFFRDTSFTVNVPLLGDPQNTNQAQVINSALTLGVNSNDLVSNAINLYPNPATNFISIDNKTNSPINSISIADTNGRTIFETKNGTNSVDVSSLSKGMYFVRLATDDVSIIKKLVKE